MNLPLRPALAFASALLLTSTLVRAAEPWDGPPFAGDPKALLEAAQKVDPGKADVVILLDEMKVVFDADGGSHTEARTIVRVVTEKGIEMVDTDSSSWAPWYSDRPELRARVIAKDGTVHTLDPKEVTEASAELEPDIFSDQRVLRAPLPGVAVGSVIEMLTSQHDRTVVPGAGTSGILAFASSTPEEHVRLVLDGPSPFHPHILNKTTVQPQITEKNGRTQIVFEGGHADALDEPELFLPSDQSSVPYIAFSTGASWSELAQRYSEIVDKQIAASDLRETAASAIHGATDRREIVARLLGYVQEHVHYAGVEVGDGSIVPRLPRGVLQNNYGDCKDKATLLVGLARAAGLSAHVVLLNAGNGLDAFSDLPGLGRFNHAIAVIDGDPAIWVDPTDEFARAGDIPSEDQGRLALVAAPSTTSLTRTPELPNASSVYAETRTFTLPEEGKARVVELSQGTGPEEAQLRRYLAESDAKKYKESLEKYGKSYYYAQNFEKLTTSEPRDLSKPFSITLEVSGSRSGVVTKGDGSVAINLTDMLHRVPVVLRDYEEPGQRDADAPPEKKRVHDFVFPEAFVTEWNYRIVLPPGFKARTLPANETKQLGTTTLKKEFGTGADGVVFAKFTLDSGKRRLTAAEFQETRIALSRLARAENILLGFDSIGQAKLNAGDVRGALEEFRRLATQHPKEAQHHIELARALLAGGLGEAARDEARRAVSVEPSSAQAHAALADVLEHDLIGRDFHTGFDLQGAIAELRKAKQLDPTDIDTRSALAEALVYGEDGYRFGRNAKINEAIDEYRAVLKEFGADAKGYQPRVMLFLAHAGKWSEMKTFVETMDDGEQKKLGRILAAAGGSGIDAALHDLEGFAVSERRGYAASVAQTLLMIGLYPQAAAMYDAASQGSANAAKIQPLVKVLKKAQRGGGADDKTPGYVVLKLMRAMLVHDEAMLKSVLPKEETAGFNIDQMPFSPKAIPMGELTPSCMADLIPAMAEIKTDGSDALGYRLRIRMAGNADLITAFVQREGGHYVIGAVTNEPETIGSSVLKMADAGQLEMARAWLNWTREEIAQGGGDDPLSGPPFAALWPKDKRTATADEIRVAAATLILRNGKRATEILTAAREKAADEQKTWIDVALVRAADDAAKAAPIAAALAKAHPDSASIFRTWASALLRSGQVAEAEAAAKARLERSPRNREAIQALAEVAAHKGDYAAAVGYAQRILDELNADGEDHNLYAWIALFAGRDLDRATDEARRASESRAGAAASLHTLAAVYAETGKSVEARQALLQSIEKRLSDKPASADWYVIGRIAENYGVPEAALSAYKKVEKATPDGLTTWELAQRRMAAMK